MIRRLTTMLAAFAIALATFAPTTADARDRRGGYRDHGYYDRHHRDRDDHGDAVAAGVIGLVLGLAIASAASENDRCDDRYGCAPPPPPRRCYDPCARQDGYYDQGYDPRYAGGEEPYYGEDDTRAQYERDYGLEGGRYADPRPCTQQVRRWDERNRRYVIVNVPC